MRWSIRVAPRNGTVGALRRVSAPRQRRWHRACASSKANGRGEARTSAAAAGTIGTPPRRAGGVARSAGCLRSARWFSEAGPRGDAAFPGLRRRPSRLCFGEVRGLQGIDADCVFLQVAWMVPLMRSAAGSRASAPSRTLLFDQQAPRAQPAVRPIGTRSATP